MNEAPQPASDPYEVGDSVKIYLGKRDLDSKYHGKRGEVVERSMDDLGKETGRSLDSYSYKVKEQDAELDIWFRHSDLVPVDN